MRFEEQTKPCVHTVAKLSKYLRVEKKIKESATPPSCGLHAYTLQMQVHKGFIISYIPLRLLLPLKREWWSG